MKLRCWSCGQKVNFHESKPGKLAGFCGNCGIQTLIKYPETVKEIMQRVNGHQASGHCVFCGEAKEAVKKRVPVVARGE